MHMYEGTLATSFDEEDMLDHQTEKLQGELAELKEKKRKLKEDIRDDITKLLEKRRTLL
ncbi:hypothetical protein A2U01_0084486, partial [Trifolium medium]|nr:hypothetical protein [Trifolium medium]